MGYPTKNGPTCPCCGMPVGRNAWIKLTPLSPGEPKIRTYLSPYFQEGRIPNLKKTCIKCGRKGCLNCMIGNLAVGPFKHRQCPLWFCHFKVREERALEGGGDGVSFSVFLAVPAHQRWVGGRYEGGRSLSYAVEMAVSPIHHSLNKSGSSPVFAGPLGDLVEHLGGFKGALRPLPKDSTEIHLRQFSFMPRTDGSLVNLQLTLSHRHRLLQVQSQGKDCLEAVRKGLARAATSLGDLSIALPSSQTTENHPFLRCSLATALLEALKVRPFYFGF